jgi:hypothetical protein
VVEERCRPAVGEGDGEEARAAGEVVAPIAHHGGVSAEMWHRVGRVWRWQAGRAAGQAFVMA